MLLSAVNFIAELYFKGLFVTIGSNSVLAYGGISEEPKDIRHLTLKFSGILVRAVLKIPDLDCGINGSHNRCQWHSNINGTDLLSLGIV